MDLGLKDRVVLITGGSQGIGRASALALAKEGAKVAICARGAQLLEQVAADISAETGSPVLPIVADMNTEEDAQRFVKTAADHFGRVDALSTVLGAPPVAASLT